MGVFDQAARFAAQAHPEVIPCGRLEKAGLSLRFREWIDTRSLPLPGGPDRTADLVAALDDPVAEQPWIIIVEFQAQVDETKLDVTLEEVAILRNRVRHGPERAGRYHVTAMLVYLRGRCPSALLDMTLPDGTGTRHAPLVWNVMDEDAALTLEAVASGRTSAGMLFWVPLMAGADAGETISRWKALATDSIKDQRRRGDLASIAMVFAELAGRVPEWQRGLEGFEMTESKIVNEWIRQGEVKGLLAQGRQKLLRLVERKFTGLVPDNVVSLINQQDSLDVLDLWFDEAISAQSIEDFLAALRQ